MARLQFPDGEIVGMLDWPGADDRLSPILATGVIDVPDGEPLSLEVWHVVSVDPTDACSTPLTVVGQPSDLSPHWLARGDGAPVDLGFLCDLPADVVVSLSLQWVVEESFQAVTHLAASLRQLTLGNSGLSGAVLSDVARLENLVYLQTWGNRFSDEGVQQLAPLSKLECLYLEEETLTAAAFGFAVGLPKLKRLGLMDVPLTSEERAGLKRLLPTVDVG